MQLPTPIHVTVVSPKEFWYANWNFWVSAGTMLLATITGWLALETRRMRQGSDKAMQELGKHAENATLASRESADAAKKSAEALKAQAEDTKKALEVAQRNADATEVSASAAKTLAEVGQRAWITISDVSTRMHASANGDDRINVTVTLRNGGNSPALEFVSSLWFELREHAPVKIDATSLNNASAGIVGPRELVHLEPHEKRLAIEQWGQVRQGTSSLLLFGLCRYKDMFGATHHTQWCFRFISNRQQFSPHISELNTMD